MRLMPIALRLALATLAVAAASSAAAAINLEATRLAFEKSAHAPGDAANLILTYRPTGSTGTLRDVRVDIEIGTNPVSRLAYRIREISVPQGDREFHMSLDLSKLGLRDGNYSVSATIDGNDMFGESNERDNTARTTLVVASRASTPTAPSGTTTRAGVRALAPANTRVIAQTTCSAFEREWSSPAEIGFHPGFGQASVVLDFEHPMTLLRSGERVRRASLRIVGDVAGRPFSELGALQATLRTRGSSSRCPSIPEVKLTQIDFDGDVEIDISRAMRDAESLTDDCARDLQVVLSFPQPRTEPREGSLLRLAPQGATLEVEIGR